MREPLVKVTITTPKHEAVSIRGSSKYLLPCVRPPSDSQSVALGKPLFSTLLGGRLGNRHFVQRGEGLQRVWQMPPAMHKAKV